MDQVMITRQQVIQAVCEEYGLSEAELLPRSQVKPLVQARHVACAVLHEAGWSWSMIGNLLNYRDCSSAQWSATHAPQLELDSVRMMVGLVPGWPAIELLPACLEAIDGGLGPA